MNLYYTGVGTRKCPHRIQTLITDIAATLAVNDWILRSGAADGSDAAFERGADVNNGIKEIFLPWKGFNKSLSNFYLIAPEAFTLAATIHPAWSNCSDTSRRFYARNCYQVLGQDLKTPSSFLVCYTEDGMIKGGTATSINLAIKYNVPVYNLGLPDDYQRLVKDFL